MLERERKYDVLPGFALPDLAGVEGVAEVEETAEQTLAATYFDTPDHRLAAVGVTLRRRTGGDDDGWHLKLPSAVEAEARHEVRVALGGDHGTVPERLRSTVSGLTGEQELCPVATIRTRRTVRTLRDESGAALAEIADDSVEAAALEVADPDRAGGDEPEPTRWREVEVELVDGEADLLDQVGRRLVEAGASRSTRASKLSDVVGGPAARPGPPLRPRDPVRQLVQDRLSSLLHELRVREPLARENLPEGVHTMRVALRRIRSTLATCRPFLDRSVTDPLRDELGWLSDALGEARDAEVRRARLDAAIDALVAERPELDWDEQRVRRMLWSSLVERHEQALGALADVFASERYAVLLDRIRELVADPPWTARAGKRVRGAYRRRVRHELRRVRRRMEAAEDDSLTDQERAHELHQARKAAKRARYAVEPLRPVYGSSAKTLVKRLKKLQSALGEHQDTVVTRRYLLDLSRSAPPALDARAALMAGALIERESLAARRYEARADKAWAGLARGEVPG